MRHQAENAPKMPDADVPDLIGALAERFSEYDIPTREALTIALCMLAEAMEDPDQFAAYLDPAETVH